MPQQKTKEFRNLTVDELREKREGLKKELFSLRVQAKLGKLEKHASVRTTKRTIARIETLLREKEPR